MRNQVTALANQLMRIKRAAERTDGGFGGDSSSLAAFIRSTRQRSAPEYERHVVHQDGQAVQDRVDGADGVPRVAPRDVEACRDERE